MDYDELNGINKGEKFGKITYENVKKKRTKNRKLVRPKRRRK